MKKGSVSKKKPVNKKAVKRSTVKKKEKFDLTLPEPPVPKYSADVPKPAKIEEHKKTVELKDSDINLSSNFKPKMTKLFSDRTKKSDEKKKEIEGEYKKHLDNHVKFAKLEIGKSHPELIDKPEMSAQQIIDSVVSNKKPSITKKFKTDVSKIVSAKKPSDTKADLVKDAFKTHIKDQISKLEFNVVFNISKDQPFFDELTELQKTVPTAEIPSPKDFGLVSEKPVQAPKKDVKNILLKVFGKFGVGGNSSSVDVEKPAIKPAEKSVEKSVEIPKPSQETPKVEMPESNFSTDSVPEGEDLDTFFKNEEKRVSAYKLVVPKDKILENTEKKKSLDEHQKELSERELELVKSRELHEREKEEFDIVRSNTEQGHNEIQEHLNEELKKLDAKRQEILDKEEELKKRSDDIARQESEVKRILNKEVELNDLKITLDTKSAELKKKESSIDRKEKVLDEKIRRNELLKAEMDRRKKLEALETQLSKKETSLSEKSAKLSEKENFLKLKEDELKLNKKDIAEKEKELTHRLSGFKKEKTAELEKKEAKLLKLQEELEQREKELKHYEEGLNISKREIQHEAERVEDAEFNMIVDEQKMKESVGGVSDEYIKFDNLDKLNDIMDMPELQQAELYRLVSRCREVLRQRNFNQAKQIYNEIKQRYDSLDASAEEKQIIYNTIRELYDDIKLAMLY